MGAASAGGTGLKGTGTGIIIARVIIDGGEIRPILNGGVVCDAIKRLAYAGDVDVGVFVAGHLRLRQGVGRLATCCSSSVTITSTQ